jgi:dihydrofolate reductase
MGNIVVSEFITLDGVIEDPGGAEGSPRGGWTSIGDEGGESMQFKFAELMASDAHLLGRVTYEGFARAWPTMEGTGEFGEKMNAMPKFVVSSTLDVADWNNTTILTGDLSEQVGKLKERYAGDILVAGSGQLATSLLALGIVDELRLMVFPVILGIGKRLFIDGPEAISLDLAEAQQLGSVAVLTLRRRA